MRSTQAGRTTTSGRLAWLSSATRAPAICAVVVALSTATTAAAAPDPTQPGPYEVGYTLLYFEKTSVTTGEPRRIQTAVWYPAVSGSGEPQPYGLRDADALSRRSPLLLFSHGYPGISEISSFLTKALASWGFVVVGPLHPGEFEGTTDADLVDSGMNRVPDAIFVIDSMLAESRDPASRFWRRIDPGRIGIAGHSFGGFTSLAAARIDRRIDAALALDPGANQYLGELLGSAPIRIPSMIIASELGTRRYYGPEVFEELTYELLRGPRYDVELLRTGHYAYIDDCPTAYPPEFRACEIPNTLSQEEAHRLVLRFAVPFLQHYVAQDHRFDALLRDEKVVGANVHAEPGSRWIRLPFRPH